MPSKVLDEITYPIKSFSCCTVQVWEWISNFIPHIIRDVFFLSLLELKLIHVSKRGPGCNVRKWMVMVLLHYEHSGYGLGNRLIKPLVKWGNIDYVVSKQAFIDQGWVIDKEDLKLGEITGKGQFKGWFWMMTWYLYWKNCKFLIRIWLS